MVVYRKILNLPSYSLFYVNRSPAVYVKTCVSCSLCLSKSVPKPCGILIGNLNMKCCPLSHSLSIKVFHRALNLAPLFSMSVNFVPYHIWCVDMSFQMTPFFLYNAAFDLVTALSTLHLIFTVLKTKPVLCSCFYVLALSPPKNLVFTLTYQSLGNPVRLLTIRPFSQ